MVRSNHCSGVYILEATQILNRNINEVWNFFVKPDNLEKITPENMDFRITSGGIIDIYKGQIITYKIRLIGFISVNWVSEISAFENEKRFVDEQKIGPYKFWHHEHYFSESDNGVKVYDKVVYKLPLGIFGRIIHRLFVGDMLMKIFKYRYSKISQVFNKE